MTQSSQESGGLPWTGLVIAAIAVGAVVLHQAPLKSTRPDPEEMRPRLEASAENIPARLWQDPFSTTQRFADWQLDQASRQPASGDSSGVAKARLSAQPADQSAPYPVRAAAIERTIDSVPAEAKLTGSPVVVPCQSVLESGESASPLLVLAAMVPSGPYAGDTEVRIRRRYALLSGLMVQNYFPLDATHIGQLVLPIKGAETKHFLDIPYECMKPLADESEYAGVLLLWLRNEAFSARPFATLRSLVKALGERLENEKWRLKVLGPADSDTLGAMMRELTPSDEDARQPIGPIQETLDKLLERKTEVFSYSATVDDRQLLSIGCSRDLSVCEYGTFGRLMKNRFGFDFHRTIATDGDLAQALADELKRRTKPLDFPQAIARALADELERHRRRVSDFFGATATDENLAPAPADEPERHKKPLPDAPLHVALIGEMDTLYARKLAKKLGDALCGENGENGACRKRIRRFGYLRGVDGKVPPFPGERRDRKSVPAEKEKKSLRGALHRPDGRSQFDYLRRLGQQLEEWEASLGERDGGPRHPRIDAIGVVGSDVYDKLLVLQALEGKFPGAVFFTTDLSANLFHPAELPWSRNLVVASGFGLRLNEELQKETPPFRDLYQTSAYLAVQLAVGGEAFRLTAGDFEPLMFEIGRYGAVPLEVEHPSDSHAVPVKEVRVQEDAVQGGRETYERFPLNPVPPTPFLLSLPWSNVMLLGAMALVFLVVYRYRLRTESSRNARRWLSVRSLGDGVRLVLLLLLAALAAIFALYLINVMATQQEPVILDAGVSIWPTEVLRLLAWALAVYYLYVCYVRVPRALGEMERNLFGRRMLPQLRLWRQVRFTVRGVRRRFASPAAAAPARLTLGSGRLGVVALSDLKSIHEPGAEPSVPITALWRQYRWLQAPFPRLLRTLPPLAMMMMIGFLVIGLFGPPTTPARGVDAFIIDKIVILGLAVPFFILLVFTVLDTIRLTSLFIRELVDNRVEWRGCRFAADAKSRGRAKTFGSGREGVDLLGTSEGWRRIQIVGELTDIVGKLVYFPFAIALIMVVSRLSYFDRWDFPVGLIIVIVLNLGWAVAAGIALRRAAEYAREKALEQIAERLATFRDSQLSDAQNQNALLHILKSEILGYRRGAFASLLHQPVVQALLLVLSATVISAMDLLGY